MDISSILLSAGFTEKQAKVYLALIALGSGSASQISERAAVKRPTTYVVLEELRKRKLVSSVTDGKAEIFRAAHPYTLLQEQKLAYSGLEAAMPTLLSLNQGYASAPKLEVHYGLNGIREVWAAMLETSTDIVYWADHAYTTVNPQLIDETDRASNDEFRLKYINERVSKGIWVRGIIPYIRDKEQLRRQNAESGQAYNLRLKMAGPEELRELVFVPFDTARFPCEISVWDDSIATISYTELTCTIIRDSHLAQSLRGIFEMNIVSARQNELNVLSEEDRLTVISNKSRAINPHVLLKNR